MPSTKRGADRVDASRIALADVKAEAARETLILDAARGALFEIGAK
jgi:hypothetical protein